MAKSKATVRYGKRSTRTKAERMFAELPQSPVRKTPVVPSNDDAVDSITKKLSEVHLEHEGEPRRKSPRKSIKYVRDQDASTRARDNLDHIDDASPGTSSDQPQDKPSSDAEAQNEAHDEASLGEHIGGTWLRTLSWDDVCPPGDCIDKIAEASYAEVYRVTNERGTSVIKVIRLPSPIKPQTKTQIRSKLVDEEPHSEEDVNGELQISEWLADIPGFVVYKERYLVKGKTSRALLETHQVFQRRLKRRDAGRAQFYPSPSRYLDDTKFLVVELGDAGVALEDWDLTTDSQLWDIFFLEAIALARAEEVAMFEHRDLHEGNLCIKQVKAPRERRSGQKGFFGYSGLDITILDYGLSRAEDVSIDFAEPVAYDLERDLGLFTSTHAPQCNVYRQMRSFMLRADRKCLPPEAHKTPYARGVDGGPLCWGAYAPYTNVLWLAYLYTYLVSHFRGPAKQLSHFQRQTADMWTYLDPDADESVPCFGCAGDVVCFAVEAGWIREEQLVGANASLLEREDSIIVSRDGGGDGDGALRRSSRRSKAFECAVCVA